MAAFDELYQAVILDHYRRPRNRGTLPDATRSVELVNPLCGDEIAVDVKLDGDVVSGIRFHGHGCSISQASASMMTELLRGKPRAEVEELIETFKAMLRGERDAESLGERMGDLVALQGVVQFPARIKCAMLGWNAVKLALEGKTGRATTTGE